MQIQNSRHDRSTRLRTPREVRLITYTERYGITKITDKRITVTTN